MHITRFGHSALLVELEDQRIVIDPGVFSRAETFELTEVDALIVTHQHADHMDTERLSRLESRNPDAIKLAAPDAAEILGWRPHLDAERTSVGAVTISAVGDLHAVIHPEIPRVHNVGVVLQSPGSPRFFHPGDSYGAIPSGIDLLAVPLSAPWAKISETIDFVRAVKPRSLFAIHDAIIAEPAVEIYLAHLRNLSHCLDVRYIKPGETAVFD